MKGILGKKIGMTRVIQDDGRVIPITVVECEPNEVAQIKTVEKDGYPALVLGFGKLAKPTKTKKFKLLREFRLAEGEQATPGEAVTVEMFTEGDKIQITSTSKGKGFQGVVKRWHMHGGPGSHGSHFKREPGSVGARAKPGKIHRGKHMAGRMGGDQVSLKSSVVYLDKKKNLIGIAGPVAGPNNSYVSIKKLS
jgi:large subunit ribosomal protein L3